MRIEDQVLNVELSKKLKELGVKQDSAFYWDTHYPTAPLLITNKEYGYRDKRKDLQDICYSAFTVAELLDIIPEALDENTQDVAYSELHKNPQGYECFYKTIARDYKTNICRDESAISAIAKLVIYIIEEGHWKP